MDGLRPAWPEPSDLQAVREVRVRGSPSTYETSYDRTRPWLARHSPAVSEGDVNSNNYVELRRLLARWLNADTLEERRPITEEIRAWMKDYRLRTT